MGLVAGEREEPVAVAVQIPLSDPGSPQQIQARRIEPCLPSPTRDGDTTLVFMTNLPASIAAAQLCEPYRQRWKIETPYERLTEQLHCEPQGLTHPHAALFGFAIVASNALALVQAALHQQHGREAVEELSYYCLVIFATSVWKGLHIVLAHAKLAWREKPWTKRASGDMYHHVSIKRLLDAQS